MRRALAAVCAVALTATACSSSSSARAPESITVFAAASLTGPFTALGTRFEHAHPGTKVVFSFGGSSALATQIDQGAPADVFASAAETNMATVVKAGRAAAPVTFVTNTLEIAAAPGNPARITSVADLARPGVKVALCEASVPCGVVAAEVLAKAGVRVHAAARQPDVKSTLALAESGEVDAAMVYVTDVRAAGSKVVGVPVPAAQNASTAYPIATVSGSRHASLAKQFVAYVLSGTGRAVLSAAGFGAP